MTSLLTDLTALTAPHSRKNPDEIVQVPIGALRAAVSALTRFEQFPLVDRKSRPEWMFYRVDIRRLKGRGRHKAEGMRHA